MGVTWQYCRFVHAETISESCFSAEAAGERRENGWISTVGFARVPRLSRATGRLSKGPTLSAHLLSPLSPRHPWLTWRAALPRVPDVGRVCRGRAPQQHPPRTPLGWYQATTSKGRTWSGSLHKRYFWSCGEITQHWKQRARHLRNTAPESSGKEHPCPREYTCCVSVHLYYLLRKTETKQKDLSIKSSLLHYWFNNLCLKLTVIMLVQEQLSITNGCDWISLLSQQIFLPLHQQSFSVLFLFFSDGAICQNQHFRFWPQFFLWMYVRNSVWNNRVLVQLQQWEGKKQVALFLSSISCISTDGKVFTF